MGSFEKALVLCPEKGINQAEVGLKHVSYLSSVLTKVSTMEDEHNQKVGRLVSDSVSKLHPTGDQHDGMASLHIAIMGALTAILQLCKHRSEMAKRLSEQVAEPLDRFYKQGCSRLKSLSKREKDDRTQLELQKAAVLKQKAQCLRLFEQSQSGSVEEPKAPTSRLFKLAGTLGARGLTVNEAIDKLDSATTAYDEMLDFATSLQDRYFNTCLPEVLSGVECLEMDRGAILVNQLKIASNEFQILSEATQNEAIQFKSLCNNIDIAKDLESLIDESAKFSPSSHTRRRSTFQYDLPISPPNSIFRKPLAELVHANNDGLPDLMMCLCHRLRELHAFTNVEGIFRVSPDKSQICIVKRQIESCESIAGALKLVSAPHLLAAVLKDWLRGLPQPLIPAECYNEALRIGGETSVEQKGSLRTLWLALPRPNRIVLAELKSIVDEVSSNTERTRMTSYNVCVCLTPAVVRTPDALTPNVALSNSKLEVAFTVALFASDVQFFK
uniref:Rho-GAP domain-containing protein n=1 Tax=Spongospora subterranea TaxID=70186 RepID=A0A0H5QVM7_9EUKA|eukprot:CRZ05666.1 hypothetical protein [Spongospora subterranea]